MVKTNHVAPIALLTPYFRLYNASPAKKPVKPRTLAQRPLKRTLGVLNGIGFYPIK